MVSAQSVLAGVRARRAMETNFAVLAPGDSLGRAVTLTLDGSQKIFPVVEDGRVVGVLGQAGLIAGLHDHGKLCRVDQVMQGPPPRLQADDCLEHVLEDIDAFAGRLLIVEDQGRMAGIIDIDNIMELLQIRKALQQHEENAW
jgi:predicted transcriptional regulator